MHLRQAAFEKGGCAIELSGKNDNLIKVENHGVVSVNEPGKPFEDEEYKNFAWTGSAAFRFYDELAGGDEEKCYDLDSDSEADNVDSDADAEGDDGNSSSTSTDSQD